MFVIGKSESNSSYFRARYYDDEMGRFIGRDPIEYDGGGMNMYNAYFVPNDTDPSGLDPKPEKQCVINGTPVSVTFDGRTLAGNGFSAPAVSGMPISVTTQHTYISVSLSLVRTTSVFDYSPARQRMNNVGPTKAGSYWINKCKTNSCSTSWHHVYASGAWGAHSWDLNPDPTTDMSGNDGPRSGFLIHGGSQPNSRGCIDIMNNDRAFKDAIIDKATVPAGASSTDGQSCCYINVNVSYAQSSYSFVQERLIGNALPY